MTDEAGANTKTRSEPRTLRGWLRDMPRWKKISLLAAGGILVTGAVLWIVDPGGAAQPAAGGSDTTSGSGLRTALAPNQPGGGTTSTASAEGQEPAAKGIFRLGFSFIAGFALGSFVRVTIRFAAIALGFWLAATLLLSYYGLVEVNWQGIDELWNSFLGNIESEWSSFQGFITGSLPAAALVATGFFVGFKRH